MKILKGYVLIKESELDHKLNKNFEQGINEGKEKNKVRVENLTNELERKEKAFQKTDKRLQEALEAIEEYKDRQSEVRDLIKQKIENEDFETILDARKEAYDRRTEELNKREAALVDEEDKKSKASYADGLADGLRRAHEITQSDRDNAMKVAMMAAASHSTPEVVKELNNGNQLGAGTEKN